MTREDALEIIRKNMPSDKSLPVYEALQTLIPELKESEDERIRMAIIHYILYETKGAISEATEHTWVKWLEKQKEPENVSASTMIPSCWAEKQKENPKTADFIPSNCVSDAKCEERWHKVEDSLPDNGREVLAKDKLGNTLLARYDGEGWDVSVYDDEDYRCHNGISKWCEIPSERQQELKQPLSEKFRPDFPAVADFIDSVDDMEKNRAIGILEDYLKWAVSSEEECRYTWKELADAIQLGIDAMKERKPEWSEEDEEILDGLISLYSNTYSGEKWPWKKGGYITYGDVVNFLKSLRPSWKSSEEQEEPEYYQHFDPDC